MELPHFSNGTSIGFLVVDFEYDGIDRMIRRRQYKQAPLGGIVELFEDSTFTYENQLDATLVKTANNAVINLGFGYEATPPFAVTSYSTLAAQAGNPLNLIEGSFTVTPATEHRIGVVAKDSVQLLNRSYDPAGRLTGIEADFAAQSLDSTIGYDGYGRKQSVTHSNGLTGNYSYDNLNRATNITWNGAGENFSQALIYGALTGNIDQVIREFGTFTYGHDSTDQLTSVAYSGTTQLPTDLVNRTFNYDFAGNRSADTANGTTKTARNIILENDKHKIYPDQNGQGRIWQKVSKTENKTELFDYQTDGKLVRYREYTNNTLTKDVFYYTDALGRRVTKKLSINNQSWTNAFAYLGLNWQILLGQNGIGEQELFVDGVGIDEHLGKINTSGMLAFTIDHLGTVINDEAIAEKKVTGPFGEHLGIEKTIAPNAPPVFYSFTGAILDVESGQHSHRHRTRNSHINSFNTEDPLGHDGGHPNLQQYGLNNPLLFSDPEGKTSVSTIIFSLIVSEIGRMLIGEGQLSPGPTVQELQEFNRGLEGAKYYQDLKQYHDQQNYLRSIEQEKGLPHRSLRCV